jgi:hypothetical protein
MARNKGFQHPSIVTSKRVRRPASLPACGRRCRSVVPVDNASDNPAHAWRVENSGPDRQTRGSTCSIAVLGRG